MSLAARMAQPIVILFISSLSTTLALHSQLPTNSTWSAERASYILHQTSFEPFGIAAGFTSKTDIYSLQRFYYFSIFLPYNHPQLEGVSDNSAAEVVWRANRNTPVSGSARLLFTDDGNLSLKDGNKTVWSSNTSNLGVTFMSLQPSGNLVLCNDAGDVLWQSFDHPTDTLLPEQPLKAGMKIISSISPSDESEGYFTLEVQSHLVAMYAQAPVAPQLYDVWENSTDNIAFFWLKNYVLSSHINMTDANQIQNSSNRREFEFIKMRYDSGLWHTFFLKLNNSILHNQYKSTAYAASMTIAKCGKYGIYQDSACTCPDKNFFHPVNPTDMSQGCLPVVQLLSCSGSHYQFIQRKGIDYWPLQKVEGDPKLSESACKNICLLNCTCKVAFFRQYPDNTTRCFHVTDFYTLSDEYLHRGYHSVAYIKVISSHKKKDKLKLLRIFSGIIAAVFIALVVSVFLCCRKIRIWKRNNNSSSQLLSSLSFAAGLPTHFTLKELEAATEGFSKKIGSGGFGSVFQGSLPDGTQVAVKRLDSAKQGLKQFKAEVIAIGSMQHRNLVRLRGFCSERNCCMLVYEYMPNGSLDKWILKEQCLDWTTCFNIALDVSRGLAHLHEGCRNQVLHLDIKPQNILLDSDFTAKISDFGLSKLVEHGNGSSSSVTMIRGTPGYLAPEWLQLRVSEKIDVYSYGILLLQIVTGLPALHADNTSECSENRYLTSLIFRNAREGNLMKMISDASQRNVNNATGMMKVIHIGVWCIQADPLQRPSMINVVKMLQGDIEVLEPPLPPPLNHTVCNKAIDMSCSLSVILEIINYHQLSIRP